MSEDRQREGHAGQWVLWVSLAVVVYVLSVGPVIALYQKRGRSPEMDKLVIGFYFPLVLLSKSCRPAERAIDSYVTWWTGVVR